MRRGVFAGGPFRGGMGDELAQSAPADTAAAIAAADATVDLTKLDERTKVILARLDEDAKNRRLALYVGAVSALFAAVKLGIIAFPALKSKIGR